MLRKSVETSQIWLKSDQVSGTLRDDLSAFYCRRGQRFIIKLFVCNTQYFYIVDNDM